MRLLVVEDEKKLCDMIAKSLHQAGYEVDTCNAVSYTHLDVYKRQILYYPCILYQEGMLVTA